MPFVAVARGPLVESVHAVAACAVDAAGETRLALGDVDVRVFLRSAAKPFIAAAVVRAGVAERFGFDARELAVVSASHNGEAFHVAAVAGILAKIGLDERALQCGVAAPSYEPAATALAASGIGRASIYHNCSGKHAGLLALCVVRGADPAGYLDAAHPVQREVLTFCARMLGEPVDALPLGVDGCGIPVFATSLRRAARAFARLAAPNDVTDADAAALVAVREAIAAEPAYVAGTGRFDSALAATTAGRIVGKVGAEGVHGDALRREGIGLAVKVVDGASRAIDPATVALLRELGALDPEETTALASFARPAIRNAAGRVVGGITAGRDTISLGHSS